MKVYCGALDCKYQTDNGCTCDSISLTFTEIKNREGEYEHRLVCKQHEQSDEYLALKQKFEECMRRG